MRGIRGIREGRCIGDWGRLGTGGLGPTRSAGNGRDEGVWWRTYSGGKERGAGLSFPLLALDWRQSGCQVEYLWKFTVSSQPVHESGVEKKKEKIGEIRPDVFLRGSWSGSTILCAVQ